MTKQAEWARQVLVTAYMKRSLPWSALLEAVSAFRANAHLDAAVEKGYIVPAGSRVFPGVELGPQVANIWRTDGTAASSHRSDFEAGIERFVRANATLKSAITQIQLAGLPGVIQDDRLVGAIKDVLVAVERLSLITPRLRTYIYRFERARSTRECGHLQYLASPLVDSVHTVLFELHQDVLEISGLKRGAND